MNKSKTIPKLSVVAKELTILLKCALVLLTSLFACSLNAMSQDTLTVCSPCPNDSAWENKQHISDFPMPNGASCQIIYEFQQRVCDFDNCSEVRIDSIRFVGDCSDGVASNTSLAATALAHLLVTDHQVLLPGLEENGYACIRLIQPRCWKTEGVDCSTGDDVVREPGTLVLIACDPEMCCVNQMQVWLDDCGVPMYYDKGLGVGINPEFETQYDEGCEECDDSNPANGSIPNDCEDACFRELYRHIWENLYKW